MISPSNNWDLARSNFSFDIWTRLELEEKKKERDKHRAKSALNCDRTLSWAPNNIGGAVLQNKRRGYYTKVYVLY